MYHIVTFVLLNVSHTISVSSTQPLDTPKKVVRHASTGLGDGPGTGFQVPSGIGSALTGVLASNPSPCVSAI